MTFGRREIDENGETCGCAADWSVDAIGKNEASTGSTTAVSGASECVEFDAFSSGSLKKAGVKIGAVDQGYEDTSLGIPLK